VREQLITRTLVVFDGNMSLMLRRSLTDRHRPGEFDLPGGSKRPSETSLTGARRELGVETNIWVPSRNFELVWQGEGMRERREGPTHVFRELYQVDLPPEADIDIRPNPYEHDYFEIMPVDDIADRLDREFWSAGIRMAAHAIKMRRYLGGLVAS
jgi:8-oxo-dGTP pyrophosphatase MutT (NUDIX family)